MLITLSTDFGLKDPFVGIMKGVILNINPDIAIVDISHSIPHYNIFEASRVIASSYRYFPPGTIHLTVVDPGVGSTRRPILVKTDKYFFIGPDNGIFSLIYNESEKDSLEVFHITSTEYFLPSVGSTFHGRDIFAPVAAWLSKGIKQEQLGQPINDYYHIAFPQPLISSKDIEGEIVAIDNFGNAISNITSKELKTLSSHKHGKSMTVHYKNLSSKLFKYYSENDKNILGAIVNSFNDLELYIYQGNASKTYNIDVGDKIRVSLDYLS